MQNTPLERLYSEHVGLVSDKWTLYLDAYDRVLRDYRERPINLLEIGIQNGGSLELWASFFPAAKLIIGCDINPECAQLHYDDNRIVTIIGDATQESTQSQIAASSPELDVIIDDGSHRSGDIICAFARYFPMLSDDGLYVIEDLHCSYWPHYDGGLDYPYSAVSFFKRLVDILSHEHWGIDRTRADFLKAFTAKYGVAIDEECLSRLHSVEFLNSVCVIRKKAPDYNVLGPRFIGGNIEAIVPGTKELHLTHLSESNQVTDDSADRLFKLEEELTRVLLEIANSQTQLHALESRLAQQSTQLDLLQSKLDKSEQDNQVLQKALSSIHSSASWKLTAPMRWFRKHAIRNSSA